MKKESILHLLYLNPNNGIGDLEQDLKSLQSYKEGDELEIHIETPKGSLLNDIWLLMKEVDDEIEAINEAGGVNGVDISYTFELANWSN